MNKQDPAYEDLLFQLDRLQNELIQIRDRHIKECINPAIKRIVEIQRDYMLFNDRHHINPPEGCGSGNCCGYKVSRIERQYGIAQKIWNWIKKIAGVKQK